MGIHADHLSETFDGVQTLKADHHSVQITTIRMGDPRFLYVPAAATDVTSGGVTWID
jgi:hypothetical protein